MPEALRARNAADHSFSRAWIELLSASRSTGVSGVSGALAVCAQAAMESKRATRANDRWCSMVLPGGGRLSEEHHVTGYGGESNPRSQLSGLPAPRDARQVTSLQE